MGKARSRDEAYVLFDSGAFSMGQSGQNRPDVTQLMVMTKHNQSWWHLCGYPPKGADMTGMTGLAGWKLDITKPIPHVFKRDENGMYLPQLSDDSLNWVPGGDGGLMTMKLDGELIKAVGVLNGCDVYRFKRGVDGKMDYWEQLEPLYDEDRPLLEAWKKCPEANQTGYYCVYGLGIKGNPHRLQEMMMVKVFPVSYQLMVNRNQNHTIKIVRYGLQNLFETVKQELMESPEIEGIVFHKEEQMVPIALAQITRQGFGLKWPALVEVAQVGAGFVDTNKGPIKLAEILSD